MTNDHAARSNQLEVALLRLGAPVELTIATGAVAVTRTNHTVDTEADAATDDLATITGGANGNLLLLTAANSGRVVTLKHASGNIRTTDGQDIALSADGPLFLERGATNWLVRR